MLGRLVRRAVPSQGQITHRLNSRWISQSTAALNSKPGNPGSNSTSSDRKPNASSAEGFHFDENKPRKPLSRVAIGGSNSGNRTIKSSPRIELLSWKSGLLFLFVGGVGTWWFNREKRRLEVQREAEANRGYGKPLIGGPFNLIDDNGNPFTERNLLGKFSLVYFGFSRCPDICPDELDKMSIIIDGLKKKGIEIQPIFITCDPARDTPEVLKDYLSEFHPDIIGLTGTYEEVKNVCKKYRVYFSTPRDIKPNQDYLVDHSIFFYLMDPEGQFIDVLGRQYDAEQGIAKIAEHVEAFVPEAERKKRSESWLGRILSL